MFPRSIHETPVPVVPRSARQGAVVTQLPREANMLAHFRSGLTSIS